MHGLIYTIPVQWSYSDTDDPCYKILHIVLSAAPLLPAAAALRAAAFNLCAVLLVLGTYCFGGLFFINDNTSTIYNKIA